MRKSTWQPWRWFSLSLNNLAYSCRGVNTPNSKCVFMATSVVYLGHKVNQHGLHSVPANSEWSTKPHDVTDLKSYLGLLSYYGKFLPNLSSTLAPLHNLFRRSTPWCWTSEEKRAFALSKQLLTSSQVLTHYNQSQNWSWHCHIVLGLVLAHQCQMELKSLLPLLPVLWPKLKGSTLRSKRKDLLLCLEWSVFVHFCSVSTYFVHQPSAFDEFIQRALNNSTTSIWAVGPATVNVWTHPGFQGGICQYAFSRLHLSEQPEVTSGNGNSCTNVEQLDNSPVTAAQIELQTTFGSSSTIYVHWVGDQMLQWRNWNPTGPRKLDSQFRMDGSYRDHE